METAGDDFEPARLISGTIHADAAFYMKGGNWTFAAQVMNGGTIHWVAE